MRATVIGSGSWGTAFSRLLARRGHGVQVLSLTRDEAARLQATHENPHFLPGVRLPEEIRFAGMGDAELSDSELLVYAVPTQAVREVAKLGRAATSRTAPCSSRWRRGTRSARSSGPRR